MKKTNPLNHTLLLPLIALLGTVSVTTLRPVIVLYVRSFGISAFLVGFITSMYMLMRGIFSIVSGRISDRIGKRKIFLYLGLLGFILGNILLFCVEFLEKFAPVYVIYIIILFSRFIQGLSAGFFWPMAQVIVLESAPLHRRTFYMALYFNSGTFGFLLRDLIISFLGKINAPLNLYVIVSTIILFTMFILIYFVKDTFDDSQYEKEFKFSFSLLKVLFYFYLAILIVGGLQGINNAVTVLILNESFKYSLYGIGIIFFIKDFVRIIITQIISYIADKKGIGLVSSIIIILLGVSSLFLGLSNSWFLFILFYILTYSLAPSVVSPVRSFVSHKVRGNNLGVAIGVLNTVTNFSNVLFASLSGLWYDFMGWKTGIFFVMGILALFTGFRILIEKNEK